MRFRVHKSSGSGCSKLAVNVSLKFQMLIFHICQYFLSKNCVKLAMQKLNSLILSTKNISVFGCEVVKYLTS